MRFRPVSSSATEENPAPLRSSKPSPALQKKRGSKFPLTVLSPIRNNTQHADRETTPSLERSAKRPKTIAPVPVVSSMIDYPTDIAAPRRNAVKALYQRAMESPQSHQARNLQGTGLLSLEDVLIPAVIQKHVDAVKRVQAKAQRDDRSVVPAIQECRRALYKTALVGIQAARDARQLRENEQAKTDAARAEERRLAQEQARKERDGARQRRREARLQQKAVDRERRQRDAKRKHPRNVELWREVALLMTELAKLHKEERLWKDAEKTVGNREKELEVREQEMAKEWEEERVAAEKASSEDSTEHEWQEYVNQAMQDITLSSIRVEQAVQLVSNLMAETDAMHQELSRKYREEHQFHGYKGVNNPKGLIRAIAMS